MTSKFLYPSNSLVLVICQKKKIMLTLYICSWHQECFYLYEHGEEDDNSCCCNEELLSAKVRKQENQRETNGSSETPVGYNELVFAGDGVHMKPVHKESQHENPWKASKKIEAHQTKTEIW